MLQQLDGQENDCDEAKEEERDSSNPLRFVSIDGKQVLAPESAQFDSVNGDG